MTLNFPSSPSNGQTYSLANGATYTWDGEKWKASNIPDSSDVVQTVDTPNNGEVLKWNGSAAVWDVDNDTTYNPATQSVDGLMSSSDKSKLDGIDAGANVGVAASGGTFTGTVNFNGNVTQAAQAVSALNIDCSTGNYFTKQLAVVQHLLLVVYPLLVLIHLY